MVWRWCAFAVAGLACITGLAASPAAAPDPPARRFGLIDAAAWPDAAGQLGIGWERITFDWAAFQPSSPRDFETDSVDPGWLESARDAGREVTGLIVNTPPWASASGAPDAVPDGLDLPVDDPANVWAAFMTQVAATYAPLGVHRWIVYDTPDVRPGEGPVRFAGTVADYARLLKVAHLAARAADPQARMHVAAMTGWADAAAGRDPYLTRLLQAQSPDPDAATYGHYFDAVMLRVYDNTGAVWDSVIAARAILAAAGLDDKTIWLETNARPTLDRATNPSGAIPAAGVGATFGITPQQQADFVIQAVALALAAGADRVAISPLADTESQPWGLVRADGSRRPAFDIFRTVIALFAPATAAQRYTVPAGDLIVLEQPDRDVYVVWARDVQPVQFIITSPQVGEFALYTNAHNRTWTERSAPFDWPAAFRLDGPGAQRDPNGFLTVAGSPRVLVLDPTPGFVRVVYVVVGGDTYRLK